MLLGIQDAAVVLETWESSPKALTRYTDGRGSFLFITREKEDGNGGFMKRFLIFAFVACFLFGMTGGAMAVGNGKKVEFDEKTNGKVIFDGKAHADAGSKCADCHSKPKLFEMKKVPLKMDDMKAGKSCGACHDGKKAFGVSECAKCHKK
jgi:c(7)-type cytochrome triheme protein